MRSLLFIFLLSTTTLFSSNISMKSRVNLPTTLNEKQNDASTTLYKSLSSNPSRLNPLLATDSSSSAISSYIFSGLLKYDKDANIIGDLAKSYKIVNEKKIVFYLRKNVLWHDGKRFTAEDVLFTYGLMKLSMDGDAKRISTPYSTDFKNVKDVVAVDDYTLEVYYKKPYFKALEIWMMGIVPKHLLKDVDNYMTAEFNKKPIGTGPYKLKRMEISKSIILESFDKYYEHQAYIDRILYSIVPDATTNFYLLQKGDIDIKGLTPLQFEKKVDKSFMKNYKIVEQISKGYTYLGFNFKRKLFQDPRVREAVKFAIDKKELVDILFFKHGEACYGPFLPGSFAYNNHYESDSYKPEKAKQLLLEAGFTKEKPLHFELVTNTGNSIRLAAAQVIQYQLEKVGIKVKLRVLEWQAFLNTKVFAQDFDVVLLGWGLSLTPDAYAIWHSDGVDQKGGYNFISYKNEAVDKLIIDAESTTSKEKLAVKYRKIFSLIVEDNPYIFLYIPNEITAINKKISPIIKSIVGIEHNQIDWVKQ